MSDHSAKAARIKDAAATYRGKITTPERWANVTPRVGDVFVCTPAKAGTTWTQTMVAMLLAGSTTLPDSLTQISPWVDANFFPDEDVQARLAAQSGRRVMKTHTPADGFPVWDGVQFIAVFRHPLDILLSIRKHVANMTTVDEHPMKAPLEDALTFFLTAEARKDDIDSDCLEIIVMHFRAALAARWPGGVMLHYSDMKRDHLGALRRLNTLLNTGHDEAFLSEVAKATGFQAMKTNASAFVPESGSGLWHNENAFFASGESGGWRSAFSEAQVEVFQDRLKAMIPDDDQRRWLESGTAT